MGNVLDTAGDLLPLDGANLTGISGGGGTSTLNQHITLIPSPIVSTDGAPVVVTPVSPFTKYLEWAVQSLMYMVTEDARYYDEELLLLSVVLTFDDETTATIALAFNVGTSGTIADDFQTLNGGYTLISSGWPQDAIKNGHPVVSMSWTVQSNQVDSTSTVGLALLGLQG